MLIVGKFADLRPQVPGAQCKPSTGPGKTRAGFWSSGTSPLGTEAPPGVEPGPFPVPAQAPQPESTGESLALEADGSGTVTPTLNNSGQICYLSEPQFPHL